MISQNSVGSANSEFQPFHTLFEQLMDNFFAEQSLASSQTMWSRELFTGGLRASEPMLAHRDVAMFFHLVDIRSAQMNVININANCHSRTYKLYDGFSSPSQLMKPGLHISLLNLYDVVCA